MEIYKTLLVVVVVFRVLTESVRTDFQDHLRFMNLQYSFHPWPTSHTVQWLYLKKSKPTRARVHAHASQRRQTLTHMQALFQLHTC